MPFITQEDIERIDRLLQGTAPLGPSPEIRGFLGGLENVGALALFDLILPGMQALGITPEGSVAEQTGFEKQKLLFPDISSPAGLVDFLGFGTKSTGLAQLDPSGRISPIELKDASTFGSLLERFGGTGTVEQARIRFPFEETAETRPTFTKAGIVPGNIGLDPVFTDADGPDDTVGTADDNLRPRGGPTVNNGNASALPPDVSDLDRDGDLSEPTPLDLDGNPRARGAVDMGPYEG